MGSSLGEVIKKMAVGANDASAPTSVLFGTVTSAEPLEITVEQKLKLTKEFLVLTKNVKDYTVDISVNCNTETEQLKIEQEDIDLTHNHKITGRKQITIHNALKIGDDVILLQQQRANNFIVLDKF